MKKVIFIFDYCCGQVFKHYLTDKELSMNLDDIFEELCLLNDIKTQDAYYMSTSEDEIITI